jgi:O-antigen/teichoic acid export membrane protein
MKFGIILQGFSFVNFLQHHLDYILIGRILGTASLGYYQFATKIPDLFKQRLASPLAAVIFPAVSQFQDQDKQLLRGYGKTMRYMALGVFPAMGGLAVIAYELVEVLWGQNWLPVVLPFQIFCFCGAIRCVMTPTGAVFNTKHRPDLLFKFSLMQLSVTFIAVAGLGYTHGLNGVALGMLLAQFFSLLALKMMAGLVNGSFWTVLGFLKQPFWATACMVAVLIVIKAVLLASGLGSLAILMIIIPLGAAVYILAVKIMFRDVFADVLSTYRQVVGGHKFHKMQRFRRNCTEKL